MRLTFFGIFILVRLLQPLKAEALILLTPSGIVISVRLLQPLKAEVSMVLTLSGIVNFVRLRQFKKAPAAILITVLPFIDLGISSTVFCPLYPQTAIVCSVTLLYE